MKLCKADVSISIVLTTELPYCAYYTTHTKDDVGGKVKETLTATN